MASRTRTNAVRIGGTRTTFTKLAFITRSTNFTTDHSANRACRGTGVGTRRIVNTNIVGTATGAHATRASTAATITDVTGVIGAARLADTIINTNSRVANKTIATKTIVGTARNTAHLTTLGITTHVGACTAIDTLIAGVAYLAIGTATGITATVADVTAGAVRDTAVRDTKAGLARIACAAIATRLAANFTTLLP